MSRMGNSSPQVDENGRYWGAEAGYPEPTIPKLEELENVIRATPTADNFNKKAAGGMAGIAFSIADQNMQKSDINASQRSPQYQQSGCEQGGYYEARPGGGQQQHHYGGGAQPSAPNTKQDPFSPGYHHQDYYTSTSGSNHYGHAPANASNDNDDPYSGYPQQPQPSWVSTNRRSSYLDDPYQNDGYSSPYEYRGFAGDRDSANSVTPFRAGALPGRATPSYHHRRDEQEACYDKSPMVSPYGPPRTAPGAAGVGYGQNGDEIYCNDPYQSYGPQHDSHLGYINPNEIVDDADEGLEYHRPARRSILSLSSTNNHEGQNGHSASRSMGNRLSGLYNAVTNSSSRAVNNGAVATSKSVPGTVAVAGVLGAGASAAAGTMASNSTSLSVDNSTSNNKNGNSYELNDAANSSSQERAGASTGYLEKPSDWVENQKSNRKKWKWCIIISVALAVITGVCLYVGLGILSKGGDSENSGSGGSDGAVGGGGLTADEDTEINGDLDIKSAEIQALMNNDKLHKVFPAMDYTGLNTVFPECLQWPPSQNNITRDMAVLSQLTNTIRTYGTDCNQTEMIIHSFDRLGLDDMKIWLGVWQDANTTTNERQLDQMWNILDTYGSDRFEGIIIANEILFREEMTMFDLQKLISAVKTNLTERGMGDMIVSTGDLGDNWTEQLADISDAIMGNVHPFFAGVDVTAASEWTTTFWDNKIGLYKKSENRLNIIAETGWPTGGGSINGSIAGHDELNTFLDTWVCRAMEEKINYFFFEAFDEPWKIRFNEEGKEWEDKWGLMTVNRELKDGITIPDCDGLTVDQVNW